jgi:hypothetical protein
MLSLTMLSKAFLSNFKSTTDFFSSAFFQALFSDVSLFSSSSIFSTISSFSTSSTLISSFISSLVSIISFISFSFLYKAVFCSQSCIGLTSVAFHIIAIHSVNA